MKSFFVHLGLFFLLGCAAGNCRNQAPQGGAAAAEAQAAQLSVNTQTRVKVFKKDGSLQCGQAGAVPLNVMQKELGSMTVYSAENKSDGLMHIQACGTPTGTVNVYEIDRSQLSEAQAKGFKEWTY